MVTPARVASIAEILARLPPTVGAAVRTAGDLGRTRHLERFLPVAGHLAALLPEGLARGSVVSVVGPASLSLTASVVSAATASGSWLAMVDLDHAGHGALAEAGVALERTVCVSTGSDTGSAGDDDVRLRTVGALVDGFDIVVVGGRLRCPPTAARRMAGRVRSESCVLVLMHDAAPHGCSGVEADITITTGGSSWDFDVRAHRRRIDVSVSGRGHMAAPRRTTIVLPTTEPRVFPPEHATR